MDAGPKTYGVRFAGIQTSLTREVEQGMGLIKELLEELDNTKTALKQTQLDLDNECEGRRRLQKEAQESRACKERQGRRPFVAVLIDADADSYVFHDNFITKGAKGGEDAADALLAKLQQYVQELTGKPNEVDILVKAFANVSGLGAALERGGRLKDAGQLRAFASGFSSRQAFFDFVDVGAGKERADFKIRESIKFFLESFQCKHLLLACGHDDGYAPFLGQFVGDKQTAERITLLEGSPFPTKIRELGLKRIQFSEIFHKFTPPAMPVGAWVRSVTAPGILADRGNSVGRSMVEGLSASVVPPARSGYHNAQAQPDRLGPVLKDQNGRRVDRKLQVTDVVVERIRKGALCFYFFLRGDCSSQKCDRNHVHRPLTDQEFDALWWLARQGRCHKSRKADRDIANDCSDVMCVYGHGSKDL